MGAKRALITGVTGQDGSYLRDVLAADGWEVHGLLRRGEPSAPGVICHSGDLTDRKAVSTVIRAVAPGECYHLGAQTFVPGEELSTIHTNVTGTLHVLEAIRHEAPDCRLFLAGSAEVFGVPDRYPQDEDTAMRPRNVYGVSKLSAWHLMRVYREQHRIFACCGFLYNHESPRRPPKFVTRKITQAAARIRLGLQQELQLGDLDAVRDWGYAPDYVRAMTLMLRSSGAADYVIATGTGRTVREFVEAAFSAVGLEWEPYVRSVAEFRRPSEQVPLIGNPAKAASLLGWKPETPFEEWVREMVAADVAESSRELGSAPPKTTTVE